jgi:hypothetical protein
MRIAASLSASLAVVLVLVSLDLAAAQQRVDPRADAQMHLGPFYLTPRVAVKEFGLDGNVFNNAEEKKDFTVTLSPHVDIWVPFARRALLTTSVTTDLVYYHVYETERSFNPDIRLRGELLFNRLVVFVEPTYLRTRERLNYEIDARARRREDGLGAGFDIRATEKLTVQVAGRRSDLVFDADEVFNGTYLQETLNRDAKTGSIALRHAVTPYTTLELKGEAQALRFHFSPIRDADSFAVLPGVSFNPRALVSGSASVGYRRFVPLRDAMPRFDGLVANAALGYTLFGATQFRFTAQRDVSYSYSPVDPYFVMTGYGITGRHYLGGRFDVTAGFDRYRYAYRTLVLPGAGPASPAVERADITRGVSASFGYRFGRTARLGVGAAYRQRRSPMDRAGDYDGLRVLSTIDYGF